MPYALFNLWKPILLVIIVVAVWYTGFRYGKYSIESEYVKQVQEQREITDQLTRNLNDKQKIISNLKNTGIRTIYVEKDATGCLDTTVPDGVLQVLRNGTSGQ